MNSRFKFPRRVRIHGGDCGAVARALHHRAQKEDLVRIEQTLISDEKAFLSQADLEKSSRSTFIERKQMSTKTSTIKRIALVAVAALGFGMLSGVAANAAFAITGTSTNPSQSATAGSTVSTTVTVTGNNGDSGNFTVDLTSSTVGASASFSLAQVANPPLVFTPGAGSATAATDGTFSVAKSNGTSQKFVLYVGTSGTTTGDTVVVSSGATTVLTLTISGSTASDSVDTPWRAVVSSPDTKVETNLASIVVTNVITSSTDYTVLKTANDTLDMGTATGDFRYVEVTGSTIKNAATGAGADAMTVNGAFDSATQIAMPQNGNIYGTSAGNEIWINTATAGSVTVKFYDQRTDAITGYKSTKLLQTITINSAAAAALDPTKSTSIIRANSAKTNSTGGVASSCTVSTQVCGNTFLDTSSEKDEVIIASRKINGVSTTTDAVATIKVRLLDSTLTGVVDSILPSVGATVDGPGLVSISTAAYGASLTGTAGRNLSLTKAPANEFFINVFSDGNAGKSTISILVGGGVWKTETLSFYGDATTVKAVQGLYVLPTGISTSSALSNTYGCAGLLCDGESVVNSVASTVAVTDALGTPVPYRTFTATTSDAGVLLGIATATAGDAAVAHLGVHHFKVTVPYATTATSGKSASLTYTTGTGTTALSSNALTFTLGGVAATVFIAFTGKTEVGALNAISVTAKDAAGNKAYDADHAAILTSNVVINTAVNADQAIFTALGADVPVWNGTGSIDFYNPIVPTNLVIGGTIGGAKVAATTTVNNSAIDAATDAAAEAIDAANAATDAANLAAEAADAATVAAEEARDAADAATAAIEELATQVAALIAALQAQIKTLANTVAKIAKKVKA